MVKGDSCERCASVLALEGGIERRRRPQIGGCSASFYTHSGSAVCGRVQGGSPLGGAAICPSVSVNDKSYTGPRQGRSRPTERLSHQFEEVVGTRHGFGIVSGRKSRESVTTLVPTARWLDVGGRRPRQSATVRAAARRVVALRRRRLSCEPTCFPPPSTSRSDGGPSRPCSAVRGCSARPGPGCVSRADHRQGLSETELAAANLIVDFDAEETTCPACLTSFAPKAEDGSERDRCPDCGLFLGT